MATVETVTGPIDAAELGTTLIHEHLQARDEAVRVQWPHVNTVGHRGDEPVEVGPDARFTAQAVKAAKEIVGLGVEDDLRPELHVPGPRHRADARRRGGERASQVVPCTGIYTYDHLPMFFLSRSPEEIAELFVHDIEVGIQGTDVKAAFLKCAADEPGVTRERREGPPGRRQGARANRGADHGPLAARARHRARGRSRSSRRKASTSARVQIAHCGDSDDLDYIERLIEKGVYVGLDRFGIEMYLPFDKRIPPPSPCSSAATPSACSSRPTPA